MDNACQAMSADAVPREPGHEACLDIATRANGGHIEIVVSDTGTGMPQEVVEHVFEPLYSTKGLGVGLGMPTVRQLMRQHDGGVEVDAREGDGHPRDAVAARERRGP